MGTTGPMGSGLPQFGFPRRFAIDDLSLSEEWLCPHILGRGMGSPVGPKESINYCPILGIFSSKINRKMRFQCN